MKAKRSILGLVVILAGCTGSSATPPSVTPSMSPSESAPSPSPSPEKEKPPALADARLQGSWSLEFKGAGKSKAVVNFDPACNEGPCDVILKTDPSIRLRQKGTLYTGKDKGSFGSTCSGAGIKSSVDLSLRVRRAEMEGSKWLATVVTGVLHQSVTPQKGCSGAKQTYRFKGTPTKASPQKRNDLPALALFRPRPEPTDSTGTVPVSGPRIPYCVPWVDPVTGENGKNCSYDPKEVGL